MSCAKIAVRNQFRIFMAALKRTFAERLRIDAGDLLRLGQISRPDKSSHDN
jgi:hypothetical protein